MLRWDSISRWGRRGSDTGATVPAVPIRDLVLERGLMKAAELDRILSAEAMTRPGIAGKPS